MANDEMFERAKEILSELSEEDRDFIIDFLLSHNYPSMTTFSLAVAEINRNRYPLFRAFRTLNKLSRKELMSLDRYAQNEDQRSRDDDMIYQPPTREELPE